MRCETGDLGQFRDASTTLVLGPSVSEDVNRGCRQLLTNDGERRLKLLVVSFVRSPESWYRDWRVGVGGDPDEVVVIGTTDGFRPNVAEDAATDAVVDTQYVSSPGDLTGIGMIMGKYLERWFGTDADVHLCFDGLTTVLQYVDTKNVYRFLHLMTTRLDGIDATAHFHLDPATQDEQTVATLQSVFHALARLEGDGLWEVHRR